MAASADGVVLTTAGLKELEERLEYLKTVRRLEIAEEIKQARAFGDLSENAEYDEAKNEQARIEGEIANIEKMLRNAHVVDEEEVDVQKVNVGTFVKIKETKSGEEEHYQIVGSAEADISKGKISNESPVGKALLGRKVGATVKVDAPAGKISYKIVEIHR